MWPNLSDINLKELQQDELKIVTGQTGLDFLFILFTVRRWSFARINWEKYD